VKTHHGSRSTDATLLGLQRDAALADAHHHRFLGLEMLVSPRRLRLRHDRG
jgi:hypothetical protein